MKRAILLSLLASFTTVVNAQDGIFNEEKQPPKKGFILCVSGAAELPGADMAKRFGTTYRAGGGVLYKTQTNWMFGPKFDFIFGGNIREDSFLVNLVDANGTLITQDGQRKGIGVYERGYMTGVQVGKIFNMGLKNSDDGLLIMTGVGFMQHKINIFARNENIPQISKQYKKGYDRLTNGMYIEQYVGYNHFSKNRLVNFHIGLNLVAGFTKGRRDYLYDVMRTDDKSRLDLLFGIRGGWYIPIFKRKSEELFFE